MNEKDLNKALTDINPEFVLEAAPDLDRSKTVPFRRRRAVKAASAVAAACLLLAVGIGALNTSRFGRKDAAPTAVSEEYADADAAAEKAAGNVAMQEEAVMEEAAEAVYYQETETETETEI